MRPAVPSGTCPPGPGPTWAYTGAGLANAGNIAVYITDIQYAAVKVHIKNVDNNKTYVAKEISSTAFATSTNHSTGATILPVGDNKWYTVNYVTTADTTPTGPAVVVAKLATKSITWATDKKSVTIVFTRPITQDGANKIAVSTSSSTVLRNLSTDGMTLVLSILDSSTNAEKAAVQNDTVTGISSSNQVDKDYSSNAMLDTNLADGTTAIADQKCPA